MNYDDICAGQHTVMVRAASRICSSVSGHSETRFNIQSDLEITTARMEVNCNNGVYSLATNRPARLRCRMNAGTWRTCELCTVITKIWWSISHVLVYITLMNVMLLTCISTHICMYIHLLQPCNVQSRPSSIARNLACTYICYNHVMYKTDLHQLQGILLVHTFVTTM